LATTSRFSLAVMGGAFVLGCASALTPIDQLLPDVLTGIPTVEVYSSDVAALAEARPARTLEEIVKAVPALEERTDSSQAANAYPLISELTVSKGDTLSDLLLSSGISSADAQDIVKLLRPVYDPRKLGVGKSLTVNLAKDEVDGNTPTIESINLPISATSSLEVSRSKKNDEFQVKTIEVPTERRLAHAGGVIKSSLYETTVQSGMPASLVSEIINAYSYDVDFQREVKQGDAIDVLFERVQTTEGVQVGAGNVIYAELALGNRNMKIYRYVDSQGNSDYYNDKGESVRKALLRTPINGAKVTSGFGMRNHPLLGYTKMHRGIDFGAPTGTPIYAAGDGTVSFVGRKNGYGNYVSIKHNSQYTSAYAHMSRFASGMTQGRKVKQGQIIGYVGSTGMATGPHLHYEILANNEQVNPANVKFKAGQILQGKEMLAFRKTMAKVEAQLASIPRGGKMDVAMNYDASGNLN